tara:strand:+ start:7604 stop:8005 length:402 start_codon:yes stop_codon:yes gene_type:complete
MSKNTKEAKISEEIKLLDNKLSARFIELDPKGYFLIKVDQISKEIILEHYTNNIDNNGKAIDPSTGKPIKCDGEIKRKPLKVYRGRSAKQLGIEITEIEQQAILSKLDHALYLGRELQRAEECLKAGCEYVQD